MQGVALISAVWLTFPGLIFSADSGAKSRNAVANRFYTYTDYLVSAKESLNSLVRGLILVGGFEGLSCSDFVVKYSVL